MNNEPVAWMDGEGGFYHNDDYDVCKEHNIANDLIPLYTHPVKELPTKEDEYWLMVEVLRAKVKEQQAEIEKLRSWVEMLVEVPFFDEIDHYRGIPVSILRKAEEK